MKIFGIIDLRSLAIATAIYVICRCIFGLTVMLWLIAASDLHLAFTSWRMNKKRSAAGWCAIGLVFIILAVRR